MRSSFTHSSVKSRISKHMMTRYHGYHGQYLDRRYKTESQGKLHSAIKRLAHLIIVTQQLRQQISLGQDDDIILILLFKWRRELIAITDQVGE